MNLAELFPSARETKAPWQMTLAEFGQAYQTSAFAGDNQPAGGAFRTPSWAPETQTP